MFLTLGNLQLHDAAGLLFPDWRTGTLLHLTGTAKVLWDPAEAARVPGAQRLVEFAVAEVRELAGASPLRWSDPAYSRFNPPTSRFDPPTSRFDPPTSRFDPPTA
jgi:hypothetical protein